MGDLLPQQSARSEQRRLIIVLSGLPGSGKSALASALVQELGGTLLSFGNYVRSIATKSGRPLDRRSLQDLGEQLVNDDSEGFVEGALAATARNAQHLVIDGLRHVTVLETLRRYANINDYQLIHVHLAVAHEIRKLRLSDRPSDNLSTENSELHPVESDVPSALAQLADIKLPDSPLNDWVGVISAYIQRSPHEA